MNSLLMEKFEPLSSSCISNFLVVIFKYLVYNPWALVIVFCDDAVGEESQNWLECYRLQFIFICSNSFWNKCKIIFSSFIFTVLVCNVFMYHTFVINFLWIYS